ncbi:uncharacterized protein LOC116341090 [Contarinia nasturtii]|uniref:uncharacterized protein LOC116341090 n=1 Tax=Contarinia nasturtii TaxID=265458 RepID=UPI0012D46699|nr:uncharacterized protein LOC116341090 [Contarinia nasturtii]XP_031623817.1 uncharacterized protein LOC116341090 [Contarinia nasturtii]
MAIKKLLFLCCSFWVVSCELDDLEVDFDKLLVHMDIGESKNCSFIVRSLSLDISNIEKFNTTISVVSSNSDIVQVFTEILSLNEIEGDELSGIFQADAIDLGSVFVRVELKQGNQTKMSTEHMEIRVYRKRVLPIFKSEYLFLYLQFVHYLYITLNICLGVVFDLKKAKEIFRNPIVPIFAYAFDFIILPLTSFVLGIIYVPSIKSHLCILGTGLAVMSVVHASIHWTIILGGNINLSILINIITNVSSFVLTNLYFYSIKIAYDYDIEYEKILGYDVIKNVFQFAIPLCVGLTLRNFYPTAIKYAMVTLKWLSPFAVFNLHFFYIEFDLDIYVYGLFNWMQFLPGLLLVLLTYSAGWFWAVSLKLKNEDSVAIVVDALNKNICLAMFIVQSLIPPNNDQPDVYPSSVVISTTFILLIHLVWNKIGEKAAQNQKQMMETELKLIKSFNDYSFKYEQLEVNV